MVKNNENLAVCSAKRNRSLILGTESQIKRIILGCSMVALWGCHNGSIATIEIKNPMDRARINEMIEIPLTDLKELSVHKSWLIVDEKGKEVPYQVTHDHLLLFPVQVVANGKVNYEVKTGQPLAVDTFCCGRCYPERLDDIAWENDKGAYRLYGPSLQQSGQQAFGYDILTKSVDYPVLEERYRKELDKQSRAQIKALRQVGMTEQEWLGYLEEYRSRLKAPLAISIRHHK